MTADNPAIRVRRAISGSDEIAERRDTEAGQALVRVVIAIGFAVYIGIGHYLDMFDARARQVLSIYPPVLLIFALLIAWDIRRRPGVHPARRALCMAADFGSIALVVILGGTYMTPIFAVLLSVTVGYGMRYGTRYLIAATLVAMLTLAVIAVLSPLWRQQPFVIVTFGLSLLFVPLYANALLADTREAYRAADRANLAKARFLSHASHDLRQPVHAIGLFTNCLREANLSRTDTDMLDNIDHSLRGVTRMLRSLFDIATLDSGKIVVRRKPVSLGEVIRDVVHQYGAEIQRAEVSLRWVDSSIVVDTDPGLLTIMVQNLISNAIKYSPGARVLVGCRRQGATATIWVLDQGVGIAPENHQRVFDEFYRVPSPGRDIEGIGLGLAILRRMADLIGARIAFNSAPGTGTAIGIRGLVRTSAPTAPAPAAPAHPKSLLHGARVVLIEDDPAVLLSTRLLMERWGCVVQPLGAPSRDTGPCDIIVADYDLNGPVSGTDAIAEIRARQGWQVPAIIVTAHDEEKIRSEMHGAALPILPKPTRPAELRSVMLGMLAGGERPAPRA